MTPPPPSERKHYNGNSLIKRAGVQQEYTPEQIQEYIKCANDPVYFIRNYCKIMTLDYGITSFDMYEFQERMLESFCDERFVINLLPRQMGKTSIVAGFIAHYLIFTPEKSIGILANKEKTAKEILSRVQRMYEHFPFWIQPGVKEWNKSTIVLDNDSWVMASATGSDSIRGFSFNCIYLDEFAHVQNQHEFWESTYPTISSGQSSKVILTSTPNGLDLFYRLYTEAVQGDNAFVPIFVHWSEHPDRDEKWKQETLNNITQEQFNQEYECEFVGSGNTLITSSKLKELVHRYPTHTDENFEQFSAPRPDHQYVIVADVAEGKGMDYSAAQVIDVSQTPYQQAAVFHCNTLTPIDFAEILYRLGMAYNEAFMLVEINSIGNEIADLLHFNYEYEGLIFTESAGRVGKRVSGGFGGKTEMGIRTTKTVKSTGCSLLKMLIEQNQLEIQHFNTIQELSTFIRRGQSYEAEEGKHDDLVMCLVLFAWLSNQTFFKDMTDISTVGQLREKTDEELMQDLAPVGIVDDGIEEISDEMPSHDPML